ncbi:DUF6236 family protein [Actinoplanes sp. Pm04-4]|uniref:DUF6236 family protein n=1 Tax=Paractinoplanes pyxinae TaxID=2997416 RepID=A0ABT4AZ97_9ACTN|nr:DUF6236 family protein [Actinoplanes pyxinae]MCY1139576.1 DUF6236 family protein [Actinoplanes pyxinae]
MQAALYYPLINVPQTAWWTRTLLYWDEVGTIVPEAYLRRPDFYDDYTRALVRAELVVQRLPYEVRSTGREFGRFIAGIPPMEIDRRRQAFARGEMTRIHYDKTLYYGLGLEDLPSGLAGSEGRGQFGREWVLIEKTTAAEFMAGLALALCEPGSRPSSSRSTWVPTTDDPGALRALMSGLTPVPEGEEGDPTETRAESEIRYARFRTHLLEGLLPVPAEPLPVEKIVKFRRQRGDLLPRLRRHIEDRVEEIYAIEDRLLKFRKLDRIREELEEQVQRAERYLGEIGCERVSRSPLIKLLKFIPGLKDPIEVGQDVAESLRKHGDVTAHTLAYLAFARVELLGEQRFTSAHERGLPLIDAIAADSRQV